MKRLFAFVSLLLLLPVAASAAAPRDWSATVTQTPSGSYVRGNPAAKVRVVEYLSLTCPHCAAFSAEAWKPFTDKYVRPGKVAFEVRHAIRDGYDLTATLLARCEGPRGFFGATETYFASQADWIGKASAAQVDGQGLPPEQLLPKLASAAGLDKMAVARGLAPAKVQACLTSKPEIARVVAMADEAWKQRKIPGTPAFLINGQDASDVHGWMALDQRLTDALR